MTYIEIIALVTALIVIVKTAILLKHQRFWYSNVTRRYWKGTGTVTMILSFAVAGGILLMLLQELTIIQIWAVMLFAMALISGALAPFSKYMLEAENKWFSESSALKKGWLAGIIWMALSIWVLVALAVKIFHS